MKLRLLKLMGLLLLGATLNVAVAWACCAASRVKQSSSFEQSSHWEWLRQVGGKPLEDHDPYTHRTKVASYSGFGVEYLVYLEHEHIWKQEIHAILINQAAWAQQVRAGWPLRCMVGRTFDPTMITRKDIRGLLIKTRKSDSLPMLKQAQGSSFWIPHQRIAGWELGASHAPLLPLWPGFAINTLFYAGVLWVLFAGPFALRWMIRRRRGRCPACNYPIGQSPVCTECGAAVAPTVVQG